MLPPVRLSRAKNQSGLFLLGKGQFTFLDARRHAAELARRAWPGSFDSVIRTVCDPPTGTVASAWHAPTIAKKSDTTVDELRAALETAPGIFL